MRYYLLLILYSTLIMEITAFTPETKSCIARDCKELYEKGHTCSGVYSIKPDKLPAFEVYCDMSTNGGGWTVFQRRMDGTVDFYRNWTTYAKGFGDLDGEFWLGLDKIHRLTAASSISLRIELKDFDGAERFAQYSSFKVGNAVTKYTMNVSGYSGNAGDSMYTHNNAKFSTRDQDNDKWPPGECATRGKGGWWYTSCHLANLNGLYLVGKHYNGGEGVNWYQFRGHLYSLYTTEMKIKRNN